jgi:hypothetical protein
LNGHGYNVPQLTDSTQGYELARVELDNFEDRVLLQLLIDALERVINGANYYYAQAKKIWRETFQARALDVAKTMIRRAVDADLNPWWVAIRDLQARLIRRGEELTAEEARLIQEVRDDRDTQVNELQDQIERVST